MRYQNIVRRDFSRKEFSCVTCHRSHALAGQGGSSSRRFFDDLPCSTITPCVDAVLGVCFLPETKEVSLQDSTEVWQGTACPFPSNCGCTLPTPSARSMVSDSRVIVEETRVGVCRGSPCPGQDRWRLTTGVAFGSEKRSYSLVEPEVIRFRTYTTALQGDKYDGLSSFSRVFFEAFVKWIIDINSVVFDPRVQGVGLGSGSGFS